MTTVFIWNNNQITHKIASRINYSPAAKAIVGHSSINIDDTFLPVLSDSEDFDPNINTSYVSWLPGPPKKGGSRAGRLGQTFLVDLLFERYAPDHIIRIPNPPPPYLQRMRAERDRYTETNKKEMHHYKFYLKNCSRIVSRVLRRGWNKGGGNIKYGQLVFGLWTPLMVKRLALDLKGGPSLMARAVQMTWNDFLAEQEEKKVLSKQTGALLRAFKRRASNRGSSEATPLFRFEKYKFGKALGKSAKEGNNFPAELLIYSELVSRGVPKQEAFDVLCESLEEYYVDDSSEFLERLANKWVSLYEREMGLLNLQA
ncbi:MAG: hypothetical protein MI742_06690 [Desulfobacterales bacterium]|nr:hypothetical protein [Desulfobacterales bacterium]